MATITRPPLPPFTHETCDSKDTSRGGRPEHSRCGKVALAYGDRFTLEESPEFVDAEDEIIAFLSRK